MFNEKKKMEFLTVVFRQLVDSIHKKAHLKINRLRDFIPVWEFYEFLKCPKCLFEILE